MAKVVLEDYETWKLPALELSIYLRCIQHCKSRDSQDNDMLKQLKSLGVEASDIDILRLEKEVANAKPEWERYAKL